MRDVKDVTRVGMNFLLFYHQHITSYRSHDYKWEYIFSYLPPLVLSIIQLSIS